MWTVLELRGGNEQDVTIVAGFGAVGLAQAADVAGFEAVGLAQEMLT